MSTPARETTRAPNSRRRSSPAATLSARSISASELAVFGAASESSRPLLVAAVVLLIAVHTPRLPARLTAEGRRSRDRAKRKAGLRVVDSEPDEDFVRAVALGYDLDCRLLMALGPDLVRGSHRSAEGTSSTFGALGEAASLARLDETGMRFAISYAAQQVSGLWSWVKDEDHVEKSFDFAGMGARNGVMAATMAEAGLTGVADVLDGTHNLFIALSTQPKPEEMLAGLGSKFYVTETAIKTFSVGYPIQSPLDALLALRKEYKLTPDNVSSILVKLPTDAIGIVGESAMPDVNCQHLVAVALVKGAVSFADSHDVALMHDPKIMAQREKVSVKAEQSLMDPAAPRGAIVEVTMTDGKKVEHFTKYPPGTKEDPLSTEAVSAKVRDLMTPVLGHDKTEKLIGQVNALEKVDNIKSLVPLFTA